MGQCMEIIVKNSYLEITGAQKDSSVTITVFVICVVGIVTKVSLMKDSARRITKFNLWRLHNTVP